MLNQPLSVKKLSVFIISLIIFNGLVVECFAVGGKKTPCDIEKEKETKRLNKRAAQEDPLEVDQVNPVPSTEMQINEQPKRFTSNRLPQAVETCLSPHLPRMAAFLDVWSVLRLERTCIRFYNGLELDPTVVRMKQLVMSCRLYPTRGISFLDFETTFKQGLDHFCRPTKVTFLEEEIPMKRLAFGLCVRYQLQKAGVQASTFDHVCNLVNGLSGNSDTESMCSSLVEGSFNKLFEIVVNEAYGPWGAFPHGGFEDSDDELPSSYELLLNSSKKYILKKMTFKQMCSFASGMRLFLEGQTKRINCYPTENEVATKAQALIVNIVMGKQP